MSKAPLICCCVFAAVFGTASRADLVQINGGQGYGFLFHYGDECLMLLPSHVHEASARFDFQGADPRQSGMAAVERPEIDGLDLSLAVILQQNADMPCGPGWFDLAASRDQAVPDQLSLRRLQVPGVTINTPIYMTQMDAVRLVARIAPGFDDMPIYQGTSGAVAFAGDRPVGMAIEASDEQTAIFLRFSRILRAVATDKGLELDPTVQPVFDSTFKPVGSPQPLPPKDPVGTYSIPSRDITPVQLEGSPNAEN